jgi:RNA polymerase sigma-70 factor (ECF subfamily)
MKTPLLEPPGQDALYEQASADFGAALGRLARSYEVDADKQRDLLQEIHLALWRSFAGFEGTCSIRTWVYRVAHNVAASHILRQRRYRRGGMVSLEDTLEDTLEDAAAATAVDRSHVRSRLYELIHRLTPLDRQVILLYLEGCDAASIGEITGMTPGSIATRVHRIKRILADRFQTGRMK